jgi:D-alanine-D-alanine ligase
MRVLVLHSDVAPDAPPDEQDTLITARAIADALRGNGHEAVLAPFTPEPAALKKLIESIQPQIVFNMVESVFGEGQIASIAPAMLEKLGVPYTGVSAAAMAVTGDKPLAKNILRAAGLPTPDWSEPPDWEGLAEGRKYVVKSATEDASLELDDNAVVASVKTVRERAHNCAAKHGGRWFAEAYVEGREFNVAILEEDGGPRVLPIAEMQFVDWAADRPKIVGYAAKWDDASKDSTNTVRVFGWEKDEPALYRALCENARGAWKLFGLTGYARVDFRVDAHSTPLILEINPNPCLEPKAGFAAAAGTAGLSYADTIERILRAAKRI